MIGDEYKNYTFMTNMNILMSNTPDDVDKRQGGLFYDIYTAVAQFGALIFNFFNVITLNMHPTTAQGEYLDLFADDAGITRLEATNSIKKVNVYDVNGNAYDIDIDTVITPKGNGNLLYSLVEKIGNGEYKARCLTTGKVGNSYIGECDLIENVSNIGSIIMSDVLVSARDEETDEELRERIREASIGEGFGGNIIQYRELVGSKLSTVSQMQVYARDYGESILNSMVVSIVDNDNKPFTQEQLDEIKEQLDPSSYPGGGRGLLPFGHHPQVVSPTEVDIDMSMTVIPKSGYSVEGLRNAIEEKISNYIDTVKNHWAHIDDFTASNLYSVIIYQAQVIAEILQVEGVLAINDLTINNIDTDYVLTETKQTQEMPKMGQITLA